MGAPVPTMHRPLAYGSQHVGKPLFVGEQRTKRSVSQCCPNCGAPATRNVLHCEYCRTEFDDSTPGINIYALCDFDPETERMVNGKIRSYLDPAQPVEVSPAATLAAVVGAFMGCPHVGLAIASRLVPMQDETFRK